MRITLTRDYRKIGTNYGLFQNLSGDSNIELTDNVQSDGIILRPFQIVTVNQTVWARKLSGAGTGVLAVLPFVDAEETSDEDGETSDDDTSETVDTQRPPLPPPHHHMPPPPPKKICANPYDCFDGFPKPPPHHHAPPHDDSDGYIIKIPRALVERGQNKFVVDFSN